MPNKDRERFARLVNEKKRELMNRDPKLSSRDAFLKATDLVLKDDMTLLSAYRADVQHI